MFEFLKTTFQILRPFNCFSQPTEDPEHNEPSIHVLDHRKDNLITEDDGRSTQRQESGINILDQSSRIVIDTVTRGRSAPSIDDRLTLREERQDDARSESQTIRPGESEQEMEYTGGREDGQQGRGAVQPRKTAGAVEIHQQEPEGERGAIKEAQLVMDGIFHKNVQNNKHTDETAAKLEEISAMFSTETNPSASDQISKSAAAPPTTRFSQASSVSLSAPSRPAREEILSPVVHGEIDGASSSLSPWDAYERPSPIPESPNMHLDDHNMPLQSGSPSRQQSLLLELQSSPQQAHAVVCVVSTQAESPVASVRLRAQSSNESLATTSTGTVSSDWEGTILDMECKSAKGGEPVYFQGKLDTFARRDAIAENIVNRLGMKWKPDPKGRTFQVMGDGADVGTVICPLGYVTLSLRVVGRQGRLKFKFYVLADSDVGRAFDCVLGCKTTMNHFLALQPDGTHQESPHEDPLDE